MVGAVVLVVAVVLIASAGDDEDTPVDPFLTTATIVSPVGAYGTAGGEGLTPVALTAVAGKTDTTDGGREVPQGTVNGPGRRIFAGVTIRLPRGRQPFVLRQIVPADLTTSSDARAFVRWDGWLAVLTPDQVRAGRPLTNLAWQKAGAGVAVPAGSTVRLRTMFRIPQGAGRCAGPSLPSGADDHRTEQILRRAPAWMVRRAGRNTSWQWLRVETQDVSGLPVAVRSGPTRPVLFRGASVCQAAQTSVSVDPDPDPLHAGATAAQRLPLDSPSGY